MSFTLMDALKVRERERSSKMGSLKQQADEFAALLKAQDAQRKRDAYMKEQVQVAERNLEALRAKERQRLEDERRTKWYFQMDKYGRKIPAARAPEYFGDTIEKYNAWIAHGKGQFSLDGEVTMKGEFRDGDLVDGVMKWSDGTVWEGKMVNRKMDGVGYFTSAVGERKEAMMRGNMLICYKDELQNGKQIEFEEQVFNIYPTKGRKPVATIVRNIRDWVFLCKFQDEVWPEDRKIDLAVTARFNLLRLRPVIYTLEGFGIPCEPERIYDHRYVPKIDRSVLRDTAANVLQVQEATAAVLAQQQEDEDDDTVSALDVDDDATVSTNATAARLRQRMGSVLSAPSRRGSIFGYGSASAKSGAAGRLALLRTDTRSSLVSGLPMLNSSSNSDVRGLYGPSLKRHIPRFPVRDKRDRSENIFESRMVGIGAAKEEDDRALQEELKKRQWKALIEERRAKYAADKEREIEAQQQQSLLAEASAGKRQEKQELEDFQRETQLAIEDELRMLSR